MELFYCVALGLVVGLISSFLGIGGGIIIVPMLPLIAGLSTKQAIATSMSIIVLVSLRNTISFSKQNLVPWAAGLSIGAGAAIGSFVSSFYIDLVEEKYLVLLLLVVILFVALRLLVYKKNSTISKNDKLKSLFDYRAFIAGLGCGVVVGLTGIGGGVLYGPLLLAFGLVTGKQMSPGSNLAMLMASVTGVTAYLIKAESFAFPQTGSIRLDLAIIVFSGAFLSSTLGMRYQAGIEDRTRKMILCLILALVFMKTLERFYTL